MPVSSQSSSPPPPYSPLSAPPPLSNPSAPPNYASLPVRTPPMSDQAEYELFLRRHALRNMAAFQDSAEYELFLRRHALRTGNPARHALRDLRASQDPEQWGTRQPARKRYRRDEEEEEEEEEVGVIRGWMRWIARLFEPARDDAWGGMVVVGPFGAAM